MSNSEAPYEPPAVVQLAEAVLAGALFGYASGRDDRRGVAARTVALGLLVAAWVPAAGMKLLRAAAFTFARRW